MKKISKAEFVRKMQAQTRWNVSIEGQTPKNGALRTVKKASAYQVVFLIAAGRESFLPLKHSSFEESETGVLRVFDAGYPQFKGNTYTPA